MLHNILSILDNDFFSSEYFMGSVNSWKYNEKGDAVAEIKLPGYKKSEIDYKIQGEYILFTADSEKYGKRIFHLPLIKHTNKINVSIENGILTLTSVLDKKSKIEVEWK